ncbi:hypothetical protein PTW35_25215 (plasmid) [Photobacterium sp. DA100]|uniref:hypothetical protein n=1 Tax=Photobacterium sp. DA100 TaxID=3027472 RepID=UPI00247B15B7|nr:hypothetical protein [Photobacterium sp. DA100]WEM44566.1 hypothetical protein PTW35_25215 [Photobacterium sp. DA100]
MNRMNKSLIYPMALFSAVAFADGTQQTEPELYEPLLIAAVDEQESQESRYLSESFTDDAQIERVENRHFPKRTRALTGIEYENIDFKGGGDMEYLHFIYADGFTKVTDYFSMGYVLKEIHFYNDGKSTGQANYSEIIPAFFFPITDTIRGNVFMSYEKVIGNGSGWNYDKYMIKPGLDFDLGQHFLHVNLEMGYEDSHGDNGSFIESEPLYLYKMNDKVNLGAKVLYVDVNNDWAYREFAVKPLVQFNFDNGNYLELRYENGWVEGNGGNQRHDYDIYALYTELPINDTFSVLADIQYKMLETSKGNAADQDIFFSKVGLVWKF